MTVSEADGLLAVFADAGVLMPAEVHVARALGRLAAESDPAVLLAAALATRAVRLGSVCLELESLRAVTVDVQTEQDLDQLPWPQPEALTVALRASPLVVGSAAGPLRPLHLVEPGSGPRLYLDRYFRQEQTVREILDTRGGAAVAVDPAVLRAGLARHFPEPGPDRQRLAAALAVLGHTTVLAGGPGTGKTYTVARILRLLLDQQGERLRVGLAAPTGRAAAQLAGAVRRQGADLGLPEYRAQTIHRMLGFKPGARNRFRHGRRNHLPYDVVVIDETSMVSLTLMCRLLEALRPDARLILVGDPHQLTSVDAGAVLGDLEERGVTAAPSPMVGEVVEFEQAAPAGADEAPLDGPELAAVRRGVVRLARSRRFDRRLGALADAVREGRADEVVDLAQAGGEAIDWVRDPEDVTAVRADVLDAARATVTAAADGRAKAAAAAVQRHRVLCAHSEGPSGVTRWAQLAEDWAQVPVRGGWYPGQPLLVTANDYDAGVFNGDVGVVIDAAAGAGEPDLRVAFERGSGTEPLLLYPNQLVAARTVYAMTIHRSQGSQYRTVSVVIPPAQSRLLTRELLYTAITRAEHKVRLIGSEEALRAGVQRRVLRASGLRN